MKNYYLFLVGAFFAYATINAKTEKCAHHIMGLENECARIDSLYKELDSLIRDGQEVVYINREGIFENPNHQLNIYKFCYDVNVELTPDQKASLAQYHAHKAYNAVGRVMREVPDDHQQGGLYDQCARQTGMVIETIACALTPYPECGNVLTGITDFYARLEAAEKQIK